jgi:hypothetical protein
VGAEKVAREELGMNMMQPCCSAVALLEVLKGKIVPEPIQESVDYAKSVLLHTQWSGTHFGKLKGCAANEIRTYSSPRNHCV